MTIKKILVDEVPQGCGDCCLFGLVSDSYYICYAVQREVAEIVGDPYSMKYRRSDCPLVKSEESEESE